jgi:hypothetical protein
MQLVDAKADATITGVKKMSGIVNYYGPDPKTWREAIPLYAGVRYEEIYPGVDLVYYGNLHVMEYDFVVAPGADPKAIRLRYEGADKVELSLRRSGASPRRPETDTAQALHLSGRSGGASRGP